MPLSRTAAREPFPGDVFADVLEANARYTATYTPPAQTGWAAKGLAVVTCMDSRIAPLGVLGMQPGDAKIVRNAGARVTDDVIRTLMLATHLLGVDRILVMPHTDCKMASGQEAEIHEAIRERSGIDTRSLEIRTVTDQTSALVTDIARLRAFPLFPPGVVIGGAILDVATGALLPMEA